MDGEKGVLWLTLRKFYSSGSQSVVRGPSPPAVALGKSLEMKVSGPHLRPTESETLGGV